MKADNGYTDITIPPEVIAELDLQEGDILEYSVENGALVLKKRSADAQ